MKKKFRKNQIIITALAIMIAVAGYLSFTNKEVSIIDEDGNPVTVGQGDEIQETMQTDSHAVDSEAVPTNDEVTDPEMVQTDSDLVSTDSMDTASAEDVVLTGVNGNSDDAVISAPVQDSIGEAVLTSVNVAEELSPESPVDRSVQAPNSDVIINAKLNREQTRSKSQELLMQLVNNESLEDGVKQNAVDELIAMKVFGKDIGLMDRLKKDETGEKEEEEAAEEKEEEEKEETSLEKRLEVLAAKAEKIINAVDYVHRVLTGSCGRRAFRKVSRRLLNILDSLMPDHWKIRGNVGLNDPCLNGRFSGFTSILMPFMDEHLGIDTEWDLYRCDMEAEMDGKFRLITPLKETVPLVFDKDCRKVLKKLRKVKSKLQ